MDSTQSLAWDPVPTAVRYIVRLDQNGSPLALFGIQAPTTTLPATTLFEGRPPGDYSVRVRAITPTGPGAFSSPLAITFGDVLPPGNLRVIDP